jgi:four helix bundle protein
MTLAVQAYNLTAGFPRHEAFGLTAQIRRAATSIAANIAEGYGRESTDELGRMLHSLIRSVSARNDQ